MTHPPRDNSTLNRSKEQNPATTNGDLGPDLHLLRGGIVRVHQRRPLGTTPRPPHPSNPHCDPPSLPRDNSNLHKSKEQNPALTNGSLCPDLHDEVLGGGIVGRHQRGPFAQRPLLRSPQDLRGLVVPHHPPLLLELLAPGVPVRIVLDLCNSTECHKGVINLFIARQK